MSRTWFRASRGMDRPYCSSFPWWELRCSARLYFGWRCSTIRHRNFTARIAALSQRGGSMEKIIWAVKISLWYLIFKAWGLRKGRLGLFCLFRAGFKPCNENTARETEEAERDGHIMRRQTKKGCTTQNILTAIARAKRMAEGARTGSEIQASRQLVKDLRDDAIGRFLWNSPEFIAS